MSESTNQRQLALLLLQLINWVLSTVPELRVLVNPKWRIVVGAKCTQLSQVLMMLALKVYSRVPETTQALQVCWLLSHVCTVLGYASYGYWNLDPLLWYTFSTYSIVSTYFLVTYRHASLTLAKRITAVRQKKSIHAAKMLSEDGTRDVPAVKEVPLSVLLKSENTHLLGNALLIATTKASALKLAPMAIYSFMNLITYYLTNMCPIDDSMIPLINNCEDGLLIVAAAFDNALPLVYLDECFEDSHNGVHALILYCIIYGLRLDNSESSRVAFKLLLRLWQQLLNWIPVTRPLVEVLANAEVFMLNGNIEVPNKNTVPRRVVSTTAYDDTWSIIYDF